MSSNKATNIDSCRDLNGRRLSTIKEAQKCGGADEWHLAHQADVFFSSSSSTTDCQSTFRPHPNERLPRKLRRKPSSSRLTQKSLG